MKNLRHFLIQFDIREFDSESNNLFAQEQLFIQDNKYYLISKEISDIISKTKKPFYAGFYLGKARGDKFFPSINFLELIKPQTKHKIWIDKKTAWLFICGRDLFAKGIYKTTSKVEKGKIALVLNAYEEVLGFVKVTENLKNQGGVVAKHILDIGDFLRREKRLR